jgi:hypothetical protein
MFCPLLALKAGILALADAVWPVNSSVGAWQAPQGSHRITAGDHPRRTPAQTVASLEAAPMTFLAFSGVSEPPPADEGLEW